jgi:hypothetical protein
MCSFNDAMNTIREHDPSTRIECDRCPITVCASCIVGKFEDEVAYGLNDCPIPSDVCPLTIVYEARRSK